LKHQDNLLRLRSLFSEFSNEIEADSASGFTDLAKISENLMVGVLRELLDLPNLRNLNVTEHKNYPGIDLADDVKRIAIQITSTSTLDKVKETLQKVIKHELFEKYDQIIIYVLARKQQSYSQASIDLVTGSKIEFRVERDILDFRDLSGIATNRSPSAVQNALRIFESYKQGGQPAGLSERDFDPPAGTETITTNLVEIFFPRKIYLADLIPEARSNRRSSSRKAVRAVVDTPGKMLPTDFEVHNSQLVTFYNLEERPHPFEKVIDAGTVTSMLPEEFFDFDEVQERVFKSLLRFLLQARVQKHRLQWMPDENLFIFLPATDDVHIRKELWRSGKVNSRVVFQRKPFRKDPTRFLPGKHFAFGIDFIRTEQRWYAAIVPDWYFSTMHNYSRSPYSDDLLSWLKRHEVNRSIYDHFRFASTWLIEKHEDDMIMDMTPVPKLSFSDVVELGGNPVVPDAQWLPVEAQSINDDDFFKFAEQLK